MPPPPHTPWVGVASSGSGDGRISPCDAGSKYIRGHINIVLCLLVVKDAHESNYPPPVEMVSLKVLIGRSVGEAKT